MPTIPFTKLTREKRYLRAMIFGQPGRGKSMLAKEIILRLAKNKPNFKVCIIDTENGMSHYVEDFEKNKVDVSVAHIEKETDHHYILDTITEMAKNIKPDLFIVDSISYVGQLISDQCSAGVATKKYTKYEVNGVINRKMRSIYDILKEFKGHVLFLGREARDFETKEVKGENCRSIEYDFSTLLRVFFDKNESTGKRQYKAECLKNRLIDKDYGEAITDPLQYMCNLIDKLESVSTVELKPTLTN